MQQRHLCQMMGIKLSYHTSNFEILERAEMLSVEEIITKNQLRWTGHVKWKIAGYQTSYSMVKRFKKSHITPALIQRCLQNAPEKHR